MVYVPHDGYDGCAIFQIFRAIFLFNDVGIVFLAAKLHAVTKLICDEGDGLGVQPLVDGNEHAKTQAGRDYFVYIHVHH